MYPIFNEAKALSGIFDNSYTNRSSFSKRAGISLRDSTNLFLDCTKVVVVPQAKFELLRRASQKVMTVESLVSLQHTPSSFSETEYQSPACDALFEEYEDTLFLDNVVMHETPSNTGQEASIASRISQTLHVSYSVPN